MHSLTSLVAERILYFVIGLVAVSNSPLKENVQYFVR